MKYIDFIVQTLLLVATLILATVLGGTGILLGQFIFGVWQMLSSVISVSTNTPFRKMKIIHLTVSTGYVGILLVLYSNSIFATNSIALIIAMALAWVIGFFYYGLTYAWANADSKRSKFLPNISF
jgi:hypothetical protein